MPLIAPIIQRAIVEYISTPQHSRTELCLKREVEGVVTEAQAEGLGGEIKVLSCRRVGLQDGGFISMWQCTVGLTSRYPLTEKLH